MSDIPSHLSKWEPSRLVKIAFVAFAAACVFALFFAKVYNATVIERRKVEMAMRAERGSGAVPAFSLQDRAGQTVSLESLRGKVVFINFWATWCAPCREEMPSLAQLARGLDARDVAFVTISVDEGWEEVDTFFGNERPPFVVLRDPGQSVSKAWGTTKFPESFVVDRDGTLAYKIVGARDWSLTAARKLLEKLDVRRVAPPVGG